MERLYVCGSFRFLNEMEELERRLKEEKIEYAISKEKNKRGILGCLQKIDNADVVYVVNPEGYVGRSVCIDIGYAYAKDNPIYTMNPIDDPPIARLISGVLSLEELSNLLRRKGFVRT